jgi:hypothetical protein
MKKVFDWLSSLSLMMYLTVLHLLLFVGMGLAIAAYRFVPSQWWLYTPPALLAVFVVYGVVRLLNRGTSKAN